MVFSPNSPMSAFWTAIRLWPSPILILHLNWFPFCANTFTFLYWFSLLKLLISKRVNLWFYLLISNYILLLDFQFLLTYCTVYISAVLIFTPEIGDFQKCQALLHFETLCQMRKLFFSTTFQGLTRYGNIENKTTFQGLTRYGNIENIFLNIYIAVSCWSLKLSFIWQFGNLK